MNTHITLDKNIKKFALFIYEILGQNNQVVNIFKEDKLDNPGRIYGGIYYGVSEKMSEGDLKNLMPNVDESIVKEVKLLSLNKTYFYSSKEVVTYLINYTISCETIELKPY